MDLKDKERKYSFSAGIEVPSLSDIIDAASDYDNVGVSELEVDFSYDALKEQDISGFTVDEKERLAKEVEKVENFGKETSTSTNKVVDKSSKETMEKIFRESVIMPTTMADLKASAIDKRVNVDDRQEDKINNANSDLCKTQLTDVKAENCSTTIGNKNEDKNSRAIVTDETAQVHGDVVAKEQISASNSGVSSTPVAVANNNANVKSHNKNKKKNKHKNRKNGNNVATVNKVVDNSVKNSNGESKSSESRSDVSKKDNSFKETKANDTSKNSKDGNDDTYGLFSEFL